MVTFPGNTRIRTAHCMLVFLLLLCTPGLKAQAPVAPPSSSVQREPASAERQYFRMETAIGDDYFDGHDSVQRIRRHMEIVRSLGIRYLRCAFSWNGIEPERGQYRFEFWDELATEAQKSGITLIPYVAYTPKWAASKEGDFWKQPPQHPEDFARIMRTLAVRYRGKITHWELWNEPDNKEYWDGSADQYAVTMIAGAKAVREVAPEDTLVLGGMTHGSSDFFEVLLSKYHLENYVDVLALHAYPESWNEDRAEATFGPWIAQMHKVAERSGRKLWLNEMGYADYRYRWNEASLWGTNVYYSYEHTRQYQANFLFKSFVLTLATHDVSLAGWYRIDDFRENDPRMPQDKVNDHLGIMDASGKPKPAYFALRFYNLLFSRPTRVVLSRDADSGSYAVVRVFQRKDKNLIVVGWLRSSNYNEVKNHSGLLVDSRREQVNLALPCTAIRLSTFDVLGKRIATVQPRSSVIRNMPLAGDRVYVGEVTCSKSLH